MDKYYLTEEAQWSSVGPV